MIDKKALMELINTFNSRLSMPAVLGYYDIDLELDDCGTRARCLCPFHNDRHPSLIIYLDNDTGRDSWWCPPCDENGDCFRFIQKMADSHSEAVEVAKEIIKKSGKEGEVDNEQFKLAQKKRRQLKKLLIRSHKLGVGYREWLKSIKGAARYEKACRRVDSIFKEMDKLIQGNDYRKALAFLQDKEKRLKRRGYGVE